MKRSPLPPRKTPLKRGRPPRRRRRPNARRPTPRREVLARINEPYREFIRRQPCAVADHPDHRCFGIIHTAHVESKGHGGRDEGNLVPLCYRAHIVEQHGINTGIQTFQRKYDYDMVAHAERLWTEYQDLAR